MKKEIWIKGLSVLIVLIVLAVISGIGTGIPIKRGLSIEEAKEKVENSNTYICEQIATTGPGWLIYKEEEEKQGVILEGKLPIDEINKNSFFYSAHNKFLIIGEKIGVRIVDEDGNIENYYGDEVEAEVNWENIERYECYDIFLVEDWDIITPIQRGSIFGMVASDEYLSIFDYI